MKFKPYTSTLINYFYNSGMCFGFSLDSTWFILHTQFASLIRLTQKSWEVHYMSHTYKFYNQSELIEWIEDLRKY